MKYNIFGLLLEVNVQNDIVRSFFESKFSSFGVGSATNSEVLKVFSVSEKNDLKIFQIPDEEERFDISESISEEITSDGRCHGYSFKRICNSYIAWDDSNCLFYIADDETYILTAVCGYLLKRVVNTLSVIGIICLHGAGVTINRSANNGLLIFGQSGSGKSSVSIKLVEKYGERIICDDLLMIKRMPVGVVGLRNCQFVNIEKKNLKENYFGICHCAVNSVDPFNTKVKLDLGEFSKDAFVSEIIPKTILFSSLERSEKCVIAPLKSTEAFKRIVKEIQFYITPEYVPVVYDLIKQCAIYEIVPSRDVEATIHEIYKVLSEKNAVNFELKDN